VRGVFADTSFYVAAMSPRDALHAAARLWLESYQEQIITTEFVLIEVGNFYIRIGRREMFLDLLKDLRTSPQNLIIPASSELFDRGIQLFAVRSNKEWSVTDCISIVVMQDLGLTDALASDRHFGQAGFRALLTAGN
jgi:predicted nucleic acid-binding protein